MKQTALRVDEAVLLAHALVARLAEQVGARILFIKGPTAVAVGARPPRPSSDVDVLVDPDGFDLLCNAILQCGWQGRFVHTFIKHAADLAFDHSAHFIHPKWPCDVDVHFIFPGLLAPPDVAFEALWSGRRSTVVAGRSVEHPSLTGPALIVALHALRDLEQGTGPSDLQFAAAAITNAGRLGQVELRELATRTGSAQAAEPLLTLCGIEPIHGPTAETLNAWKFKQSAGSRTGVMWLVELRRASWRERPHLLRTALVPPREVLVDPIRAEQLDRAEVVILHVRRWWRGMRALRKALRQSAKAARQSQ